MLLKFYKNRFKCCQITLMIFFATTVWGQEQTAGHGNNSHFSIGMAFVSSDPVYINTNRSARLIPFLSFESTNLRFNLREGATYKAIMEKDYSIEVTLLPNFQPYKSSDSISLDGMDRALTLDGSMSFSYSFKTGLDVNLETATELTNQFEGHMADLSLSQFIPIFGIPCVLKGGAKWSDQNRAQYFYGVEDDEERIGRLAYEVGSIIIPYYSVNFFYSLDSDTTLFANLNSKFLPSKVFNSPIVVKESSTNLVLGIGYSF